MKIRKFAGGAVATALLLTSMGLNAGVAQAVTDDGVSSSTITNNLVLPPETDPLDDRVSAGPSIQVYVPVTEEQAEKDGISLTKQTIINLPDGGQAIYSPSASITDEKHWNDSLDKYNASCRMATGCVKIGSTYDRTVKWHFFRVNVYFNKRETLKISYGAGACTVVVSFIPDVGPILAAACGALSLYAGYAADTGRCVGGSLKLFRGSPVSIYYHSGRYCK